MSDTDVAKDISLCFALYHEYGQDMRQLLVANGQHFHENCPQIETNEHCQFCHVFTVKDRIGKFFSDKHHATWYLDLFYPDDFVTFLAHSRL